MTLSKTKIDGWRKILYLKRIDMGLSQKEFAKHIGSTQQTVSKYEKAQGYVPGPIFVDKVKTRLGVDITDMVVSEKYYNRTLNEAPDRKNYNRPGSLLKSDLAIALAELKSKVEAHEKAIKDIKKRLGGL